jgi:hypothetical protein
MALPVATQHRMLEQSEQVMGDDTDAEKFGIGFKIARRQALHAKANLQLLDAVIRDLAALAVPD